MLSVQAAGRDRSQVEPEIQLQKKEQQENYRDRDVRYAIQRSETKLTQNQRDLLVGWRAMQAGESLASVEAIVAASSEQAQLIWQQQGRDAALKYLEQVMAQLLPERENQAQHHQR